MSHRQPVMPSPGARPLRPVMPAASVQRITDVQLMAKLARLRPERYRQALHETLALMRGPNNEQRDK